MTVDEIYAWVTIDEEGDEGVAAFHAADTWHPMVSSNIRKMNELEPYAQAIANLSGQSIQLRRFTHRTDLKTLTPEET